MFQKKYSVSSDNNRILIVWDLLNNYMKKQIIDTNDDEDIYSYILFFNNNI